MVNKKISEIRKKTDSKLHDMLKDLRVQLQNMRFSVANAQIKNPHKIKETKKQIARILTELNSRVKSADK